MEDRKTNRRERVMSPHASEVTAIDRGRPESGIRFVLVSLGTVASWHSDEGWGAISAPERSGLGFVHFSQIRGIEGYRELTPGGPVEFEWQDDFGQDGVNGELRGFNPPNARQAATVTLPHLTGMETRAEGSNVLGGPLSLTAAGRGA